MSTFVEFYTVMLGFVNFKCFQDLGLYYPPKVWNNWMSFLFQVKCLDLIIIFQLFFWLSLPWRIRTKSAISKTTLTRFVSCFIWILDKPYYWWNTGYILFFCQFLGFNFGFGNTDNVVLWHYLADTKAFYWPKSLIKTQHYLIVLVSHSITISKWLIEFWKTSVITQSA